MGSDPHLLDPDHHPTPFTADEIRAGSPLGRTIRQRVEEDGQAGTTRVQQYVAVDDEVGTRRVWTFGVDGSPVGTRLAQSTWRELQGHASFPRATTTVDDVTIDTPMGPQGCLRYTTLEGDGVATFWFARSIPGMPVRTERWVAGRLVDRVEMLSSGVEPVVADGDLPSLTA